jgi:hypothetical protein
MKVLGFNTPAEKMVKSKAMLAGIGLVAFGGYLMYQGNNEFGYAMVLNGFGYLGIRDAQ